MSEFAPFDFLAPYDFNLTENSPDSGSKLIKDELNLWSTAQFTYDSQAAPSQNQLISSSFNPFILNMHTPPVNTPNLSQSGVSPDLSFFAEAPEYPGLISPHPAFPVNSVTTAQIQGFSLPTNSSIEPEPKSTVPNKRKHSAKDVATEGKHTSEVNAEEDKRRRNTAASARFRIKKKLREQVLESTAQEMTAKAEALEAKVKELEKEVDWLRGLLLEKNPSLLKNVSASEVTE